MAQATITLTDSEDGEIIAKVNFGAGMDENSDAHHAALEMLSQYLDPPVPFTDDLNHD